MKRKQVTVQAPCAQHFLEQATYAKTPRIRNSCSQLFEPVSVVSEREVLVQYDLLLFHNLYCLFWDTDFRGTPYHAMRSKIKNACNTRQNSADLDSSCPQLLKTSLKSVGHKAIVQ